SMLGQAAANDPVQINVVLLEAKNLPKLEQKAIDRVLRQSKTLIKQICRLEVDFVIHKTVDADDFLQTEEQRIPPYALPKSESFDPFAGDPRECYDAILTLCKSQKDLGQLRSFVISPESANQITNAESAADVLTNEYLAGLGKLATIKIGE